MRTKLSGILCLEQEGVLCVRKIMQSLANSGTLFAISEYILDTEFEDDVE